jgi:hypothetical protein
LESYQVSALYWPVWIASLGQVAYPTQEFFIFDTSDGLLKCFAHLLEDLGMGWGPLLSSRDHYQVVR